jgi:hypothetical protein
MPVPMICSRADILSALGNSATMTPQQAGMMTLAWMRAERMVKQFVHSHVAQANYTEILPAGQLYLDYDTDLVDYEEVGGRPVPYARGGQMWQVLSLRELPVRSITNVWETFWPGGLGWPDSAKVPPENYYLDMGDMNFSKTGHLVRYWFAWAQIRRSIRVDYVAGYAPAELAWDGDFSEFKQAVIATAVKAYHTLAAKWPHEMGFAGVGAIGGESIDNTNINWDSSVARYVVGEMTGLSIEVQEMLSQHRSFAGML